MNTLQFPNKELIESQAATWVAAIDGGMSSEQEDGLTRWLARSSLHGEILIQVASMWDVLDLLKPIGKVLPIESSEPSSSTFSAHKIPALAAAITLLVVGVLFNSNFLMLGSNSTNLMSNISGENEQLTVAAQIYVTAVGERSNIILEDGSEIKLNTDSVVSVRFTQNERRLELSKGEAFFKVAKNRDRPFVVLTANNRVTAVGTAFSIDVSDNEDTEVLVTEGRVKVDRLLKNPLQKNTQAFTSGQNELAISEPPVYLSQGQKVLLNKNKNIEFSYSDDFDSALAWREGMIVFEGESLDQAIREIDRYIPLEFRIVDKEIASIPVGGFFKTGDLDQLLLVLERNFGVTSERKGDQILLSSAL